MRRYDKSESKWVDCKTAEDTNKCCSVIALAKLYDLQDERLTHIQVKGDLIVNQATAGRIMTRSRARNSKPNDLLENTLTTIRSFTDLSALHQQYSEPDLTRYRSTDPDQYTQVPANLKILKVLIEELQAAGGANPQLSPTEIAQLEEANSDDGDWEDDPDTVDLTSSTVKNELMAFAEEKPYASRQRDDETQGYLMEFFRSAAQKPGFDAVFAALTEEEREKLRTFGS